MMAWLILAACDGLGDVIGACLGQRQVVLCLAEASNAWRGNTH